MAVTNYYISCKPRLMKLTTVTDLALYAGSIIVNVLRTLPQQY